MASVWIILTQLVLVRLTSGLEVDVAKGKPAGASSRFQNRDPGLAVDGDTDQVDPNVMTTGVNQGYGAWWVDLQTQVQGATVKIYFRTGSCTERRTGVKLYTSTSRFTQYPEGNLCHTFSGIDIPDTATVNCTGRWQYLMVYRKNGDNILDFGEVEVLVCSNGSYGQNCDKACKPCIFSSCDRYTGACTDARCNSGWSGADNSLVNIAQDKQAYMSSYYGDQTLKAGGAVDGTITTTYDSGIIQTDVNKPFAWWTVDLEEPVQDALVKIYFRTDTKARRNGVQMYTSATPFPSHPEGQLCSTVTGNPDGTDIPDVFCVKCSGSWRYLMIYTKTDNGDGIVLDFGEVEVLVCPSGTYGVSCSKQCSSHCVDKANTCNQVTGACTGGCSAGWSGEDCSKVCLSGTYGTSCSQNCRSRHCLNKTDTCDPETGVCPAGGCTSGWTGEDCSKECLSGSYGHNCSQHCSSRHCVNTSDICNQVTGVCPAGGCTAGWSGEDCSKECLSGSYGHNCSQHCSSRHCVNTSDICNQVTGVCPAGGCTAGWSGEDCSKECLSGSYGHNCSQHCSSRHCVNTSDICNQVTGVCPAGGCTAGWSGEDCSKGCQNTTYGANCTKHCSERHCNVSQQHCDRFTGNCSGDCAPGWMGIDCIKVCQNDTYGLACGLSCGNRNCRNMSSSCYHETGECDGGCHPGWNNTDCTEVCPSGTYGDMCGLLCSSRKCMTSSDTCEHINGTCPGGCMAGWHGIDCTQECHNGTYGSNRVKYCITRKCRVPSSFCDRVTGHCPDGCENGWKGRDCTNQCPDGTFGLSCSPCNTRHCQGESSCPADGTCSGGCQAGWTLSNCSQVCPNGSFGRDCNFTCGNCTGDICNHVTGNCPGGCKAGWRGPQCKKICQGKMFGANCKNECGHCNGICDTITGHCPDGCEEGYNGTLCQTMLQKADIGTHSSRRIYAAAGAVGGIFVIVIITAVFIVQRRKRTSSTGDQKETPKRSTSNASGARGNRGATREDGNLYMNAIFQQPEEVATTDKPKIRVKAKPATRQLQADPDPEEEYLDEEAPPPNRDYYNDQEVIREIPVQDLEVTIKTIKHKDGGFEAQYCCLPSGFTASYQDSQKPENTGKNKFTGYYPYDYNRVRLATLPGIPGSDYINASIMHNYDQTKTYIASQAPNKKTVGDFWRMIWEHRCARVVMLTGLVESRKVKCYQYWPDEGTLDTDQFQVQIEITDTRANYTLRHLKVTSKQTGATRTVVQYHYTSWPDHGVPDTLALAQYLWMVRRSDRRTKKQTSGPLLVHCSAGIGRTGTYIAVDSLLDQARKEGIVDVQGYVSVMRGQRKNMIQTKEQYECVFHCLVEMTKFGNTSMDVENFTISYSSRGVDSVVDRKTIRELTQMAAKEERKEAPSVVDGNQDFIVRAGPSLRNLHGYLLAVIPPPGLEKLLWKLVEENDVHNVIVMSQIQGEIVGEKGTKKKYGVVTLTTKSQTRLAPEINMVTVQLQTAHVESSRNVRVFKMCGSPSMDSAASCLLKYVQLHHLSAENTPAVIIHSETNRKCAVSFCIMGNILSSITEDRCVDAIGHVRTFFKCCPDLAYTEEDVEKLHVFAKSCVEMTGVASTYANIERL